MNRDLLVTIFCVAALAVGGVLVFGGKADAGAVLLPVITGFLGYLVPRDGGKAEPKGPGGAALLLALVLSAGALEGCDLASRRRAVDAGLTVAQIACALYEANAGRPVPEILTACNILDEAAPFVRDLVEANKAAKAKAAAAGKDGGP